MITKSLHLNADTKDFNNFVVNALYGKKSDRYNSLSTRAFSDSLANMNNNSRHSSVCSASSSTVITHTSSYNGHKKDSAFRDTKSCSVLDNSTVCGNDVKISNALLSEISRHKLSVNQALADNRCSISSSFVSESSAFEPCAHVKSLNMSLLRPHSVSGDESLQTFNSLNDCRNLVPTSTQNETINTSNCVGPAVSSNKSNRKYSLDKNDNFKNYQSLKRSAIKSTSVSLASQSINSYNHLMNSYKKELDCSVTKRRCFEMHSCDQTSAGKINASSVKQATENVSGSPESRVDDQPTDLSMRSLTNLAHSQHPSPLKHSDVDVLNQNSMDQQEPLNLSIRRSHDCVSTASSSRSNAERKDDFAECMKLVQSRSDYNSNEPDYSSNRTVQKNPNLVSSSLSMNTSPMIVNAGYQYALPYPASELFSFPNQINSLSLAHLSQLLPLAALMPPSPAAAFPFFPSSLLPSVLSKKNDDLLSTMALSRVSPLMHRDAFASASGPAFDSRMVNTLQYQPHSDYRN